MERLRRFIHRVLPLPFQQKCFKPTRKNLILTPRPFLYQQPVPRLGLAFIIALPGCFWYLGVKKDALPEIVKAGYPVLHEPALEVNPEEIGSERIQKIIDDMVKVMRRAPGGVGLTAPQIGIPLRIIVLEDTKKYISYAPKEETKAQDRQPFDLLVVLNPELKKKGNKTALFFEGCLSVNGFRAAVEQHSEVEVTGFDRYGQPIKVEASGWQARIFQHECDHLDGTMYVDRMVSRTFRTVGNLDLPLATGCPKLGVQAQTWCSRVKCSFGS